jgi:hypothetical protein
LTTTFEAARINVIPSLGNIVSSHCSQSEHKMPETSKPQTAIHKLRSKEWVVFFPSIEVAADSSILCATESPSTHNEDAVMQFVTNGFLWRAVLYNVASRMGEKFTHVLVRALTRTLSLGD